MEDETLDLGAAAIVCEHVAGKMPILMAVRGEALEPRDSGWQFICNKFRDEDVNNAKVWLVREVIEMEPSLLDYMVLPTGSAVTRETVNSPWKVITRKQGD